MGKLLTYATDPTQYDKAKTGWLEEGKSVKSPSRAYFWHYLSPYFANAKSKKVLDVGAGTGWLVHELRALGADAVGVEPSHQNIVLAQQLYPDVKITESTFEKYETEEKFDLITFVMSFVHIKDIDACFAKLATLLTKNGQIIATVYDFEYARAPRFDYKIDVENINAEEYVALVERKDVTIADIVRTSDRYAQAAKKSGLQLRHDIQMFPTQDFIKARPQYQKFANIPTHRVLVFGW